MIEFTYVMVVIYFIYIFFNLRHKNLKQSIKLFNHRIIYSFSSLVSNNYNAFVRIIEYALKHARRVYAVSYQFLKPIHPMKLEIKEDTKTPR
jgi:hypothetical protein